jgi:hypothetical protein
MLSPSILREAFVEVHEHDVLGEFRAACQRILVDVLVAEKGMDPLELPKRRTKCCPSRSKRAIWTWRPCSKATTFSPSKTSLRNTTHYTKGKALGCLAARRAHSVSLKGFGHTSRGLSMGNTVGGPSAFSCTVPT